MLGTILLPLALLLTHPENLEQNFSKPIDALSVEWKSDDTTGEVSGWDGTTWSEWKPLTLENEQDPLLKESNLVLFPKPVSRIRFQGASDFTTHPIRLSKDPVHWTVASTSDVARPRILSRTEWGADESLGVTAKEQKPETITKDSNGDTGATADVSKRVSDCEEAVRQYPKEFQAVNKVTKNKDGERLLWAQEYSQEIRLFVVHHTALKVTDDARPAVERVRALYQYHAVNRGWGDVGYNYLIDEAGQIYEGRAGGPMVVGGHTYCHNVGTIGVALLGNFDIEKPTQDQMKSLQWLLSDLAKDYDVDLSEKVAFHGKVLPTIVGHRDLVSTDCPGYYVKETLPQVRKNAAAGDTDKNIQFPVITKKTPVSKTTKASPVLTKRGPIITRRSATLSRKIRATDRLQKQSGNERVVPAGENIQRQRSQKLTPIRPTGTKENPASVKEEDETIAPQESNGMIRIRLTKAEKTLTSCANFDASLFEESYRGTVECSMITGAVALINELTLEDYMMGLAEEPDTEPMEKQRAFAIAARTYAAFYMDPKNRKFPGMPYDGSDDPAFFQAYAGKSFEKKNPRWLEAVRSTGNQVLTKNGSIIKAPYFSTDDGKTRTPAEAGWIDFPFSEIFGSKPDPWCAGMKLWGHGVGMSGCGAGGQAREGKKAEEILRYYYPGTKVLDINTIN